ncbi:uncharacterized protein LOC142348521 [Convolutriloba macropyga]|uniref:uncharacterized protein LOC142348521 n=1 Tax=Convolutriloba macropyga TaxID=536237 RepID=UPI003F520E23
MVRDRVLYVLLNLTAQCRTTKGPSINRIWIQDGITTHYYECFCWIYPKTENPEKGIAWQEPVLIGNYTERNEWPENCPVNSSYVVGIPDKCFHHIEEEMTFEEARRTCKERLGYTGSLFYSNSQLKISKIEQHFHLPLGRGSSHGSFGSGPESNLRPLGLAQGSQGLFGLTQT